MSPSGKSSKASRSTARNTVVNRRGTPWGLIAGVLVVVLFAGGIFGYAVYRGNENSAAKAALAAYTPSDTNKDPSAQIQGVVTDNYTGNGQGHIVAPARVAYTHSPPMGGDHDQYWAACTGVVYPTAVRQENLVHSLEHGAVWIAYNPDRVSGDALDVLKKKVDGQPYTVMAPYPGLDQPISLQAWNHQLKLADANDPRIDQFITALRRNQYVYPEIGATCQALGPGAFDQDNPPAFQPTPAVGEINGTTVVAERSGATGTAADPSKPGQ
ncbi:DUF3105 domain-containing protein [Pseudonocardia ailaonensis]|uniref:DUF3105 domain-containing protein n=1 Tax=Pseudonocardia ailaonensis TaxID=367279 RepID=A0ABN2NN13_9PSEU